MGVRAHACACPESRFCHCARKRNRVGAIIIGLCPLGHNASRALDVPSEHSSESVISVRRSCSFAAVPHVTLRQLVGSPPAGSCLPSRSSTYCECRIASCCHKLPRSSLPWLNPKRRARDFGGLRSDPKAEFLPFYFLFQF